MIQDERIYPLNSAGPARGKYVLYWMQAAQRAEFNHALEYAIRQANSLRLPLLAAFGLTADYPQANLRHYTFMLQGLAETQQALRRRGVQLVVRRGDPQRVAIELARDAALLVTDRGYTRHQVGWWRRVVRAVACRAVQVETDVVVPVDAVSDRAEPNAATLRAKLRHHLRRYLVRLEATPLARDSLGLKRPDLELDDPAAVLRPMRINHRIRPVAVVGGTSQAKRLLRTFLETKLADYAAAQRDPAVDGRSGLSPYLHFGQISPVYVAIQVRSARTAGQVAKDAFLEQLIVRRELSFNFLRHCRRYDSYLAVPAWARASLARARRTKTYTLRQLEHAETHDPYWNAAMSEMLVTGRMHGYMRMYWGKQILAWTASPAAAFRRAVYLNNAYFLDGRDPNGWANVGWCFGLHDQPFPTRAAFGAVRPMTASGLERKFDMDAYLARVDTLCRREGT